MVFVNGLMVFIKFDLFVLVVLVQVWVKIGSIYENVLFGVGFLYYFEYMFFKGMECCVGWEILMIV